MTIDSEISRSERHRNKMNKRKTINFHGYNHYGFDMAMTIAEIVDAGHKNHEVVIDLMTEPLDIQEIEWKHTKFLDIIRIICKINDWPLEKFRIESYNLRQPSSTWPNMAVYFEKQPFTFIHDSGKTFEITKDIDKHFGIFINGSSWPRLWLSAYLHQQYRQKADQTFVRTLSNPSHAGNLDLDALVFNFSKEGFINDLNLKKVAEFLDDVPITDSKIDLDDINIGHFNTQHHIDAPLSPANDDIMLKYRKIFVDIVCETMFSGDVFSIDEKMARCLHTKTPFIVFGSTNTLKQYKKIGFKTFDRWWNEDYDYATGVNRLLQIKAVIDRIAGKTIDELKKMHYDMTQVLDHNHNVYHELCERKDLAEFFKSKIKEEKENGH